MPVARTVAKFRGAWFFFFLSSLWLGGGGAGGHRVGGCRPGAGGGRGEWAQLGCSCAGSARRPGGCGHPAMAHPALGCAVSREEGARGGAGGGETWGPSGRNGDWSGLRAWRLDHR